MSRALAVCFGLALLAAPGRAEAQPAAARDDASWAATAPVAQDAAQLQALQDASAGQGPVIPFAEYAWGVQKDKRPGVFTKEHVTQRTIGVQGALTPWFYLGGGFIYTEGQSRSRIGYGDQVSTGATGFITGTISFPNDIALQLSGGYGGTAHERSWPVAMFTPDGTSYELVTARADTLSANSFVSAKISAAANVDELWFRPFLQYLVSASRTGSAIDTTGTSVPGFLETQGRGTVGLELLRPFVLSDVLVVPTIQAALVYDFNLVPGDTDRTALDLAGGVNISSGNFTAGLRASATVGREDLVSYGGRAFLSYRFSTE